MNKDRHMSFQYRRVNMKVDSDTIMGRSGPGYMRQPQCLSYKEPKEEEQKNNNTLGQFPHLQGHSGLTTTLMPQAGYTTLLVRVDVHVHYCTTVVLGGICLLVLGSVHVMPWFDQGGGCRHTDRPWLPRVSLC